VLHYLPSRTFPDLIVRRQNGETEKTIMKKPQRTGQMARVCFLLAGVFGLAVHQTANAEPIPDFTGYTRVGYPPDGANATQPPYVEGLKKYGSVGVTIYFTVLDQKKDRDPGPRAIAGERGLPTLTRCLSAD
jgi:hypothetical protein